MSGNSAPLVVELYVGSFGWSAGWLALGGRASGFDIEHCAHHGAVPAGAELVLQDVRTIHGAQFRDADLILASPPCTEFSFRAMPWKIAKALSPEEIAKPEPKWWSLPEYREKRKPEDPPCMNLQDMAEWAIWKRLYPKLPPVLGIELFWHCWRIQHEASEASGRYIPMVVENVKGAQPWVGRAKAHWGSYYLWGDVESVGGRIATPRARFGDVLARPARGQKNDGGSWFNVAHNTESGVGQNPVNGVKVTAHRGAEIPAGVGQTSWFHGNTKHEERAIKAAPDGLGGYGGGFGWDDTALRRGNSRSAARKAASAAIARIPYALSEYIARCYWQ